LSVELSQKGQVLSSTGLSAGYDGRPIVTGIDIQATPGKVVSIVGPNGSGKSTLLKSLVGVVCVLDGHVKLGDDDVTNLASEEVAKRGVGYVPQIDDVFPPLSVKENLEIGGYLLGRKEVPDRIEAVLEFFPRLKVMMTRKAGKLSGGERKMLAMGRVLMLSPSVLVLDEPTGHRWSPRSCSRSTSAVSPITDRRSCSSNSARRPHYESRTGRTCSAADEWCSRVRPRTSRRIPRSWSRSSAAGRLRVPRRPTERLRGRRHGLRTLNP
jgi:ABC-type branched-subunit amino acid transport system ATPase component